MVECGLHDGSRGVAWGSQRDKKHRASSPGGVRVPTYLAIGQMLVAVALVSVILLQVHGGGLGGIFGQPDSVYRTRRGIEKTLFRLTIALAIFFVVLAMLIVATS